MTAHPAQFGFTYSVVEYIDLIGDVEKVKTAPAKATKPVAKTGAAKATKPAAGARLLHFRLTIGLARQEGEWVITHEHHSMPTIEERFIEQ
jgi:hypothetical protein